MNYIEHSYQNQHLENSRIMGFVNCAQDNNNQILMLFNYLAIGLIGPPLVKGERILSRSVCWGGGGGFGSPP
jgi:hypothetical protein